MPKNNESGRDPTSEKQYEALARGEMDAGQITRINSLKNDVREKLLGAGDIFTEQDRRRWLNRLDSAKDDSPAEIESISLQIDLEKSEIRQKTSEFITAVNRDRQYFGFNKTQKISETEQWIEAFKKQPLETKREWLEGLDQKIGELKTLYERARNLTPDDLEKFSGLNRSEKKQFLREMEEYGKKTGEFDSLFSQNRQYFSAREIEGYKNDFAELSLKEREEFLGGIMGKELAERKNLGEQFKSYPEKYANRRDFDSLNLVEKKIALREMENEFQADYAAELFLGEYSGFMSHQSQNKAFQWFNSAPMEVRKMAIKVLKKQMELEAGQAKEYQELLEKNPGDYPPEQVKLLAGEFNRSSYEDKEKLLKGLKDKLRAKPDEDGEKNKDTEKFRALLAKELAAGVICRKTFEYRLEKFANMPKAERKNSLAPETLRRYLQPRQELKKQFEDLNLPAKIKENSGFDEQTYADRVKTFQTLKKIAETGTGREGQEGRDPAAENAENAKNKDLSPEQKQQINQLKLQAALGELNSNYPDALRTYDAILLLDPHDKQAQERIPAIKKKIAESGTGTGEAAPDQKISRAVSEGFNNPDLKKMRRDNKLMNDFAAAVQLNDRHNGDTVKAAEKNRHLDGDQTRIQKGLFKRTGMVLDAKGRAAKVLKLETRNLAEMNEGEKAAIQKTLKEKTADSNINFLNNHFQITSEGEVISGGKAALDSEKREKKLRALLEEKIAADLKGKSGELAPEEKSLLSRLIARQDLSGETAD